MVGEERVNLVGEEKHSKDKFNIGFNMEWNVTEFKNY